MDRLIKNIIKEEIQEVMSKKYSNKEINNAIMKKYFIHTKDGNVYSPVETYGDRVIGVGSGSKYVNIPIEEVEMIESFEDRFNKT